VVASAAVVESVQMHRLPVDGMLPLFPDDVAVVAAVALITLERSTAVEALASHPCLSDSAISILGPHSSSAVLSASSVSHQSLEVDAEA